MEVALGANGGAHGEALGRLIGVTHTAKTGDKWRLYTEDPSVVVTQVVHYVEDNGLSLISLNTQGPSLEDVFLEITGGVPGEKLPEDSAEMPAPQSEM